MKCDRCDVESQNEKFFRVEHRTLSSQNISLCPSCSYVKDVAVLRTAFISLITEGVVGLALILAFPQLGFGALLLNIGLLLVAYVAGTILHEIGHALAGAIVGIRIFYIEIGRGATILEFRWAGMRFRFRAFLFGGLVQGFPRHLAGYRLKESVFILGGPVANAIIVLIACKFLWLDSHFDAGSFAGLKPIGVVLLSNIVLMAYSLWPYEFMSNNRKSANDMLLLWRTLRSSHLKILKTGFYLYYLEADEWRKQREFTKAKEWIARGLREYPRDDTLRFLSAYTFICEDKLDIARETLNELLVDLAKDSMLTPWVLNNIAFVDVIMDKRELLSEADEYSRRAIESMPKHPTLKGTRGMVLVGLGQYDQGIELLKQALNGNTENESKAINAFCLAIAARSRGFNSESGCYISLTRKLDPHCILLNRIDTLK